jgi:hypothetical protein
MKENSCSIVHESRSIRYVSAVNKLNRVSGSSFLYAKGLSYTFYSSTSVIGIAHIIKFSLCLIID